MDFLSYNLKYYKNAIEKLENSSVSNEKIYQAKQLLKFVDDICDEGYTELHDALENAFHGVTRLKEYIIKSGDTPFIVSENGAHDFEHRYNDERICLDEYLKKLTEGTENFSPKNKENPFINELKEFSDWIGYDEETSYIFLLRDTLLPYLYFKNKWCKNIFPWLLGRKMICDITGENDADDIIIRSVINEALEGDKCDNYADFKEFCAPKIRRNLMKYPMLFDAINELLSSVKTNRIIVVESGCYGTFPMLIASVDSRVDVRMFTSIPMLMSTYGERLFTNAYEKNRDFDTLFSQDLLFRYAGFEHGKFYISECTDDKVKEKAYEEIWEMIG